MSVYPKLRTRPSAQGKTAILESKAVSKNTMYIIQTSEGLCTVRIKSRVGSFIQKFQTECHVVFSVS